MHVNKTLLRLIKISGSKTYRLGLLECKDSGGSLFDKETNKTQTVVTILVIRPRYLYFEIIASDNYQQLISVFKCKLWGNVHLFFTRGLYLNSKS